MLSKYIELAKKVVAQVVGVAKKTPLPANHVWQPAVLAALVAVPSLLALNVLGAVSDSYSQTYSDIRSARIDQEMLNKERLNLVSSLAESEETLSSQRSEIARLKSENTQLSSTVTQYEDEQTKQDDQYSNQKCNRYWLQMISDDWNCPDFTD